MSGATFKLNYYTLILLNFPKSYIINLHFMPHLNYQGAAFSFTIGGNVYVYETFGISKRFPIKLQLLLIRAETLDKPLTAKCFIHDVGCWALLFFVLVSIFNNQFILKSKHCQRLFYSVKFSNIINVSFNKICVI